MVEVKLRAGLLVDPTLLHVSGDAHHRQPPVLVARRAKPAAQRALAGPERPGQRLVHDGHGEGALRVLRLEEPALGEPDPHRTEVIGPDELPVIHVVRRAVRRALDALELHVVGIDASLRREAAHDGGRGHTGQRVEAIGQRAQEHRLPLRRGV